jgi:hypothetical protein
MPIPGGAGTPDPKALGVTSSVLGAPASLIEPELPPPRYGGSGLFVFSNGIPIDIKSVKASVVRP